MIRFGKKRSRAFLEAHFGRPWVEIERELQLRTPIEVDGVEVIEIPQTKAERKDEQS